jgi:hypothetical protein
MLFLGKLMKPRVKSQDNQVEKLFRAKPRNANHMRHGLVRLGDWIVWARQEAPFAAYYSEVGRPGFADPAGGGVHLLKHI